jgi:hypothetical protein
VDVCVAVDAVDAELSVFFLANISYIYSFPMPSFSATRHHVFEIAQVFYQLPSPRCVMLECRSSGDWSLYLRGKAGEVVQTHHVSSKSIQGECSSLFGNYQKFSTRVGCITISLFKESFLKWRYDLN